MSLRLICNQGSWSLPEGETLFGRSTSCGICLLDARLSRRHAGFLVKGAKLTVIDLGSTNGVLVNGRPIAQRADVRPGDQIVVGPCRISIQVDDAPHPAMVVSVDSERRQSEATTVASPSPLGESSARQINPLIAAAIAPSTRNNKKGTDVHEPNEYREPGTEAVTPHSKTTLQPDVLSSEERAACLSVAHNSAPTLYDELLPSISSSSGAAVEALPYARPGIRLAAGLLDAVQTTLGSLLVSLPIVVLGYVLALRQAGAVLIDGLPRLSVAREIPASLVALIGSLMRNHGISHAFHMVGQLQAHYVRAPFVTLYLSVTLSVLVFLLTHLLSTVVSTVLNGAPFWHRRLGLTIVEVATNAPPSWGMGLRRWCLLLLLWPLAPYTALRGIDGLHDKWSGCAVRKA